MTDTREKLADLEQQGRFVFHGSGADLETFEPKQAHTMIDNVKTLDGEPAIFASPFVDYAIFMALINKKNFPKGYRASVEFKDNSLIFSARNDTLSSLDSNTSGYVYVFDKNLFMQRSEEEYVAQHSITPILKIPVTRDDFMPIIHVLNDN